MLNFLERLLNRKTIRSDNEKNNILLNNATISTVLFDQSQKSTSEYIDFIANLNRIDLNNQMEKKIRIVFYFNYNFLYLK